MGIFDFLKTKANSERFVSEKEFHKNEANQKDMVPETMEQLRKVDVNENKQLKLEFFFYTNSAKKAEELSHELSLMNYTVESRISEGNNDLVLITGWTSKMTMTNNTVIDWTGEMCRLGFKFDCDFDGWGTNPNQD